MNGDDSRGKERPRGIAFAANDRYFPGLYCTLASLLAHATPGELRIYVADGGLSAESRQRLDERAKSYHGSAEIRYLPLTLDRFGGFPLGPGRSFMTYARLVLPDLLPEEESVVCLDADLLVFADVAGLCDFKLPEGVMLAAVPDAEILTTAQDAPAVAAELGQGNGRKYFNAGVMVMDLRAARECGFTARTMEFLAAYGGRCRFHDQSAINFLIGDRIAELPRLWNTPTWMFDLTEWPPELPACVLHFTNEAPWLKDSGGTSNALFRHYAASVGMPVDQQTPEFVASGKLAWRREVEAPWRGIAYGAIAMACALPGLRHRRAGYAAAARHWWRRFADRKTRRMLHEANVAKIQQWANAAGGRWQ